VRRRDFVGLAAASLIVPPATAHADKTIRLIGFLGGGAPYRAEDSGWIGVHRGLADTGYFDGKNLACDYRFSEGHDDRSPGYAAEFVRRNVDLIVTSGNPSSALAAKQATTTIPIVFITGSDHVATGIVDSLARPGGNITGVTLLAAELNSKRLELLLELVPDAKVLGLLLNSNNRLMEDRARNLQDVLRKKGVQPFVARVGDKFDQGFAALAEAHAGAVLITSDTMFMSNRQQLIDTATRHSVPAIYETRDFAPLGGLITYGADLFDLGYREGTYIGKILNGTKPADLPVEQSSKFQLVVNMKTAKTLGLTVPRSLLARADEIIEE
jgi:putative ABC transport system substrate-binding protein